MSHYASGAAFERELIHILEAAGYSCIRGAGSKGSVFSEKADIVATKQTGRAKYTGHMLIIQCKRAKR